MERKPTKISQPAGAFLACGMTSLSSLKKVSLDDAFSVFRLFVGWRVPYAQTS
jgi:hypothetical protein